MILFAKKVFTIKLIRRWYRFSRIQVRIKLANQFYRRSLLISVFLRWHAALVQSQEYRYNRAAIQSALNGMTASRSRV